MQPIQGPTGLPTIERGRRCQNCTHYDTGAMAANHYKMCRTRDLSAAAAQILDGGAPMPAAATGKRVGDDELPAPPSRRQLAKIGDLDAQFDALGLNYEFGDNLRRTGQMGICLISAARGDFVHRDYLCEKWSERVKPDGAEKADELGEEAKDRLGYDK